jgi:ribonuclease P protein component
MTKQFTLGKQERLKSRKLIEELFSKGQRISVFPYRVFYLFQQKDGAAINNSLQFGAGVGTRNFKKAVDRNRIKRLTREAWRLQKNELQKKLHAHTHAMSVFFIYTGKELPAFDFVKEKTALIIQKLVIIADENFTPPA